MSKVEKKDPVGDFFKGISTKSKEMVKKASSSEAGKKFKEKIKGKEVFVYGGGFLLLAVILFLIFGSNTFETPIQNIVNGFNRADFNTYMKAIPDFIVKEELSSSEDYEEAKKGFMGEIDDFKEEFDENYKLSYKALDKTPTDVYK